jgi:biotin transporter BioY
VILVVVGSMSRHPFGSARLSYLLPVGMLVAIAGILIWIYPDTTFRDDLLSSLAMVFLFQAIGLIWILFKKGESEKSKFTLSVLPALIGGLVMLAMVAAPAFTRNPSSIEMRSRSPSRRRR